jgi:ATP-dependent Lhr-like helicase
MVWSLFSKELQEVIKERGFTKPTLIQKEGIPPIVKGKNTLLIAPTGVGKTESILFPIFDEFVKDRVKKRMKPISILYITPLKSLNRDLLKRILWWAEKLEFEVSVRHGDTSQYERSMQAANPADMFITTPETLQAMLVGKRMRNHLRNIRWIVVDEIHELIGNKRGVQLSIALERLKELINVEKNPVQMVGLSATIGSPKKVAEFLTAGKPCEIVNTFESRETKFMVESPRPKSQDSEISERIFVSKPIAARLRRIEELIKENRSVLTFTNTREFAEILSSRLHALNAKLPIETHHSSLSKNVRIDAEEKFKREELKSLICTSSLELGIDIGSINLVLQYMSPRQVAKALQRVGRSGHKVSEISRGVIISTDPDDCFEASVIAKLGGENKIEPTKTYTKALDVLGHQIVGLSLEEYKIPLEKAYRVVKRATPFRDLRKEEFLEVCKLMQKLGYIWVGSKFDKGVPLRRRKNAWLYYYSNLSTIPDVRNYKIIDVVSDKPVGTLDAEFIALHGHVGTSFIVKGQAWKILDVRKKSILVEPEENIRAAIPAWEGELIPVPFEVSQEVGKLRRKISNLLQKKTKRKEISKEIMKEYPVTKDVANKMINTIAKQRKYGFVPDDKNILIEGWEDFVILHTPFGSLVNETLGRVLSTLLTNKLGSVGLQTDPYRIIIKLPGYQYEEVVKTFESIDPETIRGILEVTLPRGELFTWRFIHVAQRFGMISRHADYGKAYFRKIIDVYFKLPPYLEALNEIFQEKLDVSKAKKVMKMIKIKKIKISFRKGLSPLGEQGLTKKYEIVAPKRPEREIFKLFRKRLMDTKVGLICCLCGEIFSTCSIQNLPKDLKCRKCEARLLAYVPQRYVNEASRLVKKINKKEFVTREEKKYFERMMDSASLIINYGNRAVLVFAGRGIGTKTAARILRKSPKNEDELLKEILKAEVQFARTKRFWKG